MTGARRVQKTNDAETTQGGGDATSVAQEAQGVGLGKQYQAALKVKGKGLTTGSKKHAKEEIERARRQVNASNLPESEKKKLNKLFDESLKKLNGDDASEELSQVLMEILAKKLEAMSAASGADFSGAASSLRSTGKGLNGAGPAKRDAFRSGPPPSGSSAGSSGGSASGGTGGGTSSGGGTSVGGGAPTQSSRNASGVPDGTTFAKLSPEQKANAKIIIDVGRKMGMSERDIQIGLATAMQESKLKNLNGGDRDSVGLFQQRPSQGWGTVAQCTTPVYAATKFFNTLKGVSNRDRMPLTAAAQAVQRSGFPDAYAQWEGLGLSLLKAFPKS